MSLNVGRLTVMFATLTVVGVVGCGDGGPSDGKEESGIGKTVASTLTIPRACLESAGARQVSAPDEIPEVIRDLERGDVVNPAGAGNGVVEVSEYRAIRSVPDDGRPKYVVWVGHPAADADPDPAEALRAHEEAFVMIMRKPGRGDTRRATQCLDRLGVSQ